MDDRLLRMMPAARSERGLALVNCPPGGPVAQRLVQGTHNPLVLGSNPSGPSLTNQ